MINKKVVFLFLVTCAFFSLHAEDLLQPFNIEPGLVNIVERSDFSKYENGKYKGHVYRESRLNLETTNIGLDKVKYSGESLVLEETTRDMRTVARQSDGFFPIEFTLSKSNGFVNFTVDDGYPILRGVPVSPSTEAKVGQRWIGNAYVVVKPKNDSLATRIPVLLEYEYVGKTIYNGIEAESIKAKCGIRYKGNDKKGDPEMLVSTGSRTIDIVLEAQTGNTLFIREMVDETYSYKDGSTIRLKGFILHFHKGSVPGDRDKIASVFFPNDGNKDKTKDTTTGNDEILNKDPTKNSTIVKTTDDKVPTTKKPEKEPIDIEEAISGKIKDNKAPSDKTETDKPFELEKTKRGIVLLLFDLRFVADGDQLLPLEKGRLDSIADALARVPEQNFLVEGHTASVGRPKEEYELSVLRAKRIISELVSRGIPESRFVYKGCGSEKPIAPNTNETNKAKNRRVEITVLY